MNRLCNCFVKGFKGVAESDPDEDTDDDEGAPETLKYNRFLLRSQISPIVLHHKSPSGELLIDDGFLVGNDYPRH
jgi:hypothetical protein